MARMRDISNHRGEQSGTVQQQDVRKEREKCEAHFGIIDWTKQPNSVRCQEHAASPAPLPDQQQICRSTFSTDTMFANLSVSSLNLIILVLVSSSDLSVGLLSTTGCDYLKRAHLAEISHPSLPHRQSCHPSLDLSNEVKENGPCIDDLWSNGASSLYSFACSLFLVFTTSEICSFSQAVFHPSSRIQHFHIPLLSSRL